jgi:hypothetical protein
MSKCFLSDKPALMMWSASPALPRRSARKPVPLSSLASRSAFALAAAALDFLDVLFSAV